MNNLLSNMLKDEQLATDWEKENKVRECLQKIVLCALSRANFFSNADFMGGTALRIYHDLPRYSEDLDFTLKKTSPLFDLSPYLSYITKEFKCYGLGCEVSDKSREKNPVKKLDIKFNAADTYRKFLLKETAEQFRENEKIRIRMDVATISPEFAGRDVMFDAYPMPHTVSVLNRPTLFAGKLSALITRQFGRATVKGRDMFDYLFLINNNTVPNIPHLKSRLEEAGAITKGETFTSNKLCSMLLDHFESLNYKSAKEDVSEFLQDKEYIQYNIGNWDAGFFKKITEDKFSVLSSIGFEQQKENIGVSQEKYKLSR